MSDLERVSLAIEKDLIERFDALIARDGKANRSEAIRDLIRARLIEEEVSAGRGETVASVTIVYDHQRRDLADRLLTAGHDHHKAVLASMHVHLDEVNCLEVVALRGKAKDVRHLAEHMIGMKGVKHGKLVLTTTQV
ncbi:MAG TPA: nickel-responsive transcriptional regulator NikR [Polyangiales bacterium]|jgi:CopG family nickel-responsive transcriptional regulator|nr:nickel-responsive transcriptional regulator NikR [Polyangiales bacterium]